MKDVRKVRLKIKRPQFDVKECIPTDIEVF